MTSGTSSATTIRMGLQAPFDVDGILFSSTSGNNPFPIELPQLACAAASISPPKAKRGTIQGQRRTRPPLVQPPKGATPITVVTERWTDFFMNAGKFRWCVRNKLEGVLEERLSSVKL